VGSVSLAVLMREHRAFVVEEFVQNGGSPIMMQHISTFQAVSKHFRYWSPNNPRELQHPLHIPKVTVWCAIFKFGVCF
jgi:hypothetical protein